MSAPHCRWRALSKSLLSPALSHAVKARCGGFVRAVGQVFCACSPQRGAQSKLFELGKAWEREHAAFSRRVAVARDVTRVPADEGLAAASRELAASGARFGEFRAEIQMIERCVCMPTCVRACLCSA